MLNPLRAIACISLMSLSSVAAASDFSIAPDISGGPGHYTWDIGIEGSAPVANPPLYLQRNRSYTFAVNSNGIHPFWIDQAQGLGGSLGADPYPAGGSLSANDVTTGTITFDVPSDAPETLYYACGNHSEMTGPINIVVFRDSFD
jgi:hypothetical protein